jgi:hypothetical protein
MAVTLCLRFYLRLWWKEKVKLSLCLIKHLAMMAHVGVKWLLQLFLISVKIEVSGQLHTQDILPLGKIRRCPLKGRLGGRQSRSGSCVLCREPNPDCPLSKWVTVPIEHKSYSVDRNIKRYMSSYCTDTDMYLNIFNVCLILGVLGFLHLNPYNRIHEMNALFLHTFSSILPQNVNTGNTKK